MNAAPTFIHKCVYTCIHRYMRDSSIRHSVIQRPRASCMHVRQIQSRIHRRCRRFQQHSISYTYIRICAHMCGWVNNRTLSGKTIYLLKRNQRVNTVGIMSPVLSLPWVLCILSYMCIFKKERKLHFLFHNIVAKSINPFALALPRIHTVIRTAMEINDLQLIPTE